MPFNFNFDLNNRAPFTPSILLKSSATSVSASKTNTFIYKEYFIKARIKVLTILNNKVFITRIIKVIGISRTRIYNLITKARERK
jgi:hypothetical protein